MDQSNYNKHEKKTSWVVMLTFVAMIVEIIYGLLSNSMALLADGIHMGSHVLAIGLSWLAYILVRKLNKSEKFSGDSEKILSLSGYTSGLILLVFALGIMVEAVQRFINPEDIKYREAILVAIIGLVVNILSAFILHHKKEQADHNIRAAYLHVLADALTSFSAIIGLIAAMIWDLSYIDAIAAIVSSLVIIRWSVNLLKESGKTILDITTKQAKHPNPANRGKHPKHSGHSNHSNHHRH